MKARRDILADPAAVTLFNWPQMRRVEQLRGERETLIARIERLRPHSHARIALQARLADLTLTILREETHLRAPARPETLQ